MPKENISISLEKNLIEKIRKLAATDKYRNISHVIEFLIIQSLQREKARKDGGL